MCGIAGIFGRGWDQAQLWAMVRAQRHRGPDAEGIYLSPTGNAGLGHNRLSIIDLSDAGMEPMASHDGRLMIIFNGEIYNYKELRSELGSYPYHSMTDTEVVLAAYEHWGEDCLHRFVGMFAFLLWDEGKQRLFAARDRFGVKPLYYHQAPDGTLIMSSEIKALHAAGVPRAPDQSTWATYLAYGLSDHGERTFWQDIRALPPGHKLTWQDGETSITRWYDLAESTGPDLDARPDEVVQEEYTALLVESVGLRFRSDVPVGINLSGGLDSSTLLGLVHAVRGADDDVTAFTFATGDPRYDELPWVSRMLEHTRHPSVICRLSPEGVPALAESVQGYEDEPFGGLPTLAYSLLFAQARSQGVIVLLDGQGMDEQWAGYDYYARHGGAANGRGMGQLQGSATSFVQPECLTPEFRAMSVAWEPPAPFADPLRDMQYRDARYTKIPRALRFNDRASMRSSIELREPFLDHRLFELALRQPSDRKIRDGVHKWMLRRVAGELLPGGVVEAPKRPLQTPQREWLRGPLRDWAGDCIEQGLAAYGGDWLRPEAVRAVWREYVDGGSDNSFYVWQWISLGLMSRSGVPAIHG
ncbi:MAG: asparagine synthase (glutamine-hydrolyzing) [Chloroflexia bacterium]